MKCRGVGIGRQEGLKLPWAVMFVWVRFPSPVPKEIKSCIACSKKVCCNGLLYLN